MASSSASASASRMLLLVLVSFLAMLVYANATCSADTYEDGDSYAENLGVVLGELKQGYTTGQRINPDVFGQVVCYLSQKECISCAKRLIHEVTGECPNSKGARISDSKCNVRYEPYFF